ncbi:MAG: site-2 protease family protein [Chloroflexota bacterium]|nr:site-2 protease family protein [Chloroflexota bacterium]
MNLSIKLFKVKGINVKIHLTFVLILIWAAYQWSVSTGEGLMGAVFGIVATLLLFTSVTLHEFGHSLQALKFGIVVHDITLMPMGGLARIDEIPEDPGKEFRIAIAGPLVNFIIAGALFVIGLLLNTQAIISLDELYGSMGQVSWNGLLAYLTMTNLLMGLFNLIPAYPMDGGRILRASLSKRLGHSKATHIAVNVGQGLALLFGLWGFMNGSYTLVLIAIFVWMGAGQEGKDVAVKNILSEMKVSQAMTRNPQILKANNGLYKARDLILSTSQSDFPVTERGSNHVVGLLCERDLLKGLQVHDRTTPIREVMQTTFPTASPDHPLFEAQKLMSSGRVRAMPIVDADGDIIGLLTATDINEAYRLLSINQKTKSL